MAQAIKDYEAGLLRKYPDTAATDLIEELAKAYSLKAENIFAGIGSDDVLSLAFLTFFNSYFLLNDYLPDCSVGISNDVQAALGFLHPPTVHTVVSHRNAFSEDKIILERLATIE